jgi:hypothetical protein
MYSEKAHKTLDTFTTNMKGDDFVASNVWSDKGHRYSWEPGQEQYDGAVVGMIYENLHGTWCKAGAFRIDPNGEVAHAPFGMRKLMDVTWRLHTYGKLSWDGMKLLEKALSLDKAEDESEL